MQIYLKASRQQAEKKCIYLKGFPPQKVFHQSQHERYTEVATIVVHEARLHSELAAGLGSTGHAVVLNFNGIKDARLSGCDHGFLQFQRDAGARQHEAWLKSLQRGSKRSLSVKVQPKL